MWSVNREMGAAIHWSQNVVVIIVTYQKRLTKTTYRRSTDNTEYIVNNESIKNDRVVDEAHKPIQEFDLLFL